MEWWSFLVVKVGLCLAIYLGKAYGRELNVVPGHGIRNPEYFETHTTDSYESCLVFCEAHPKCQMAVASKGTGRTKSCKLSKQLQPPSKLTENQDEATLYAETEGKLIGDAFYFDGGEGNWTTAVSVCMMWFNASLLDTFPRPDSSVWKQEKRDILDFLLDAGKTDVWIDPIPRVTPPDGKFEPLTYAFKDLGIVLGDNLDAIKEALHDIGDILADTQNYIEGKVTELQRCPLSKPVDGKWTYSTPPCNEVHQIVCQRKIDNIMGLEDTEPNTPPHPHIDFPEKTEYHSNGQK